jgi:hypothetical protein
MNATATLAFRCTVCGKAVEVCDFCEDPRCRHVICHECLSRAAAERRAATYTTDEAVVES